MAKQIPTPQPETETELVETSSIIIKYKNKEYEVEEGYTAQEYKSVLAQKFPQITNSTMIEEKDSAGGVFVIKESHGSLG